jgi:hypothetical protein
LKKIFLVKIKVGEITNNTGVYADHISEIDGLLRTEYADSVVDRGYSIDHIWKIIGTKEE